MIYVKSVLVGLAVAAAAFLLYGLVAVAVALGLGLSLPGVTTSVSPAGGGLAAISLEGNPPLVVAMVLGAFAAIWYRRRSMMRLKPPPHAG